jgi:enterochelin esterase-like enzyme
MLSIARLPWQAPVGALRIVFVMALVMVLGTSRARADDVAAFESFVQGYRAAAPEQRPDLAEQFIRAQDARSGFPIVGADSSVVFFYRAQPGETVRLLGDFAPRTFLNFYWSAQGLEMERLAPDAPVFIRRMTFEPDAILNYAFRVNGQYHIDSLNRNQDQGGPQGDEAPIVSVVRLPQHQAPPEANVRAGIAQGQLVSVDEPWAMPGITIYLPPGYSTASRFPVIYTGDGSAWNKGLRLPTILDNLIAGHRIVPAIAVMIDSRADRGDWYGFNPDYVAYLARVVAYVDEHYSTKAAPEARVHFGSSAAARAALYAAQERPDLFGKLALFSPGLAAGPHVLGPYFVGDKRFDRRLQVWMSIGTYEGGMVEDLKFFERYLTRARIRHATVYTHAGHTFSNWRQMERQALEYFFAP